jgi:collagen type I/II/III/V/XI/XXIV/XXVII alpha
VTINATSAPTHVSGGRPVVALDFNRHPGLIFGVGSGGSQLLGVAVDDASGNGVTLDADSITLNDHYIGLNLAGAAAGNGGNGVLVWGASVRNFIGLNRSHASGVVANVISGNRENGIELAGSSSNTVVDNRIGTNAAGISAIANGGDGIDITHGSRGNEIGGTAFVDTATRAANNPTGSKGTVTPVFVVPPLGNQISGNGGNGVWIAGAPGNSLVISLGNVSAGNGLNGIAVLGKARGFVTFNTFGGLLAFKGAAPNGLDGLLITSTGRDNLVVRTNVFSGNKRNGIELAGNASGVTVDPDIVGLNTKGNAVLPNGGDGLLIDGTAHGNVIGGTLRSVIPQNTFSGNKGYGVVITGRAHDNRVFRSFIGTQILGVKALGNQQGGVLVAGYAYGNLIGQTTRTPANLISGNGGIGVTLGSGTLRNSVINNYIGLNRLDRYLRNRGRAVANAGHHNTIRGNWSRPARH